MWVKGKLRYQDDKFRREPSKMSVAVITGSSSGLGREYVDVVVHEFPEIDEIWMVARRLEPLP
jgi:short-subunit dehydrogenase